MGKRLTRHLLSTSCGIITGDRGTGKSTLFAYIVDAYLKEGYHVYCQYPYKGCYQIPMISSTVNGILRYDIDKEWLYSTNLSGCCILIDEARTVWPARSYAKWTVADEDFFNFLRKNDIHLFMATQAYDGLDLNVKRATDETYFLTKGFWHFTHIEASHTTLAKVADRMTEVQGRMFRKGMQKVVWDICEVPSGNFLFWRKKWYNKFVSTHTFLDKPFKEAPYWDEIFDFDKAQEDQGYISSGSLMDKWKEYFSSSSDVEIDSDTNEVLTDEEFFQQNIFEEAATDEDIILDNVPQNLVRFVGKMTRTAESKESILQNFKKRFKGQNNENNED